MTRHGVPWEMVDTPNRPFDEDVWELYDHADDWSQARDLAEQHPERLRELAGAVPARGREAQRPPPRRPGHRAGEPGGGRPARPAPGPRARCPSGRGSAGSPRRRRPTSRTAPTSSPPTSRWSPAPTAWWSRRAAASVAGRSTPSHGVPHYAYNFVGRDLTVVRGAAADEAGSARPGRPVRLRRRASRQWRRGDDRGRREGGRLRADPGHHGVLLLLRRDVQHRGGPGHPRRRRLPARAQPVRGRSSTGCGSTSTTWPTRAATRSAHAP